MSITFTIELLMRGLLVALWCWGFYKATQPGNVLGVLGTLAAALPPILHKPICGCISCMASIHTLCVAILLGWGISIELIVVVVVAAGINAIISEFI
jgi:hypothetical protein